MKIKFLDALDEGIKKIKEEDWAEYDTSHGACLNYKPFAVIIRDDMEKIVGAAECYTAYAEVYIDDFWVHSKHRDKGYGSRLMRAIENEFRGKGFNNINLVTSHFQAPEFYKKCGFKLEFTRQNTKNPKLTTYFFVKFFDDEKQTQGIVL
jgi:ribosomal protein S18 acetylase RimI-like enzyme